MTYKVGDIIETDPFFFGFDGEITQAEIVRFDGDAVWLVRMLSTGVEKLICQDYFL